MDARDLIETYEKETGKSAHSMEFEDPTLSDEYIAWLESKANGSKCSGNCSCKREPKGHTIYHVKQEVFLLNGMNEWIVLESFPSDKLAVDYAKKKMAQAKELPGRIPRIEVVKRTEAVLFF